MVLRLKTWESRSPPGLPKAEQTKASDPQYTQKRTGIPSDPCSLVIAGWSSPVARQAHNLKVVGSNPTPATKLTPSSQRLGGVLLLQSRLKNERSINPNDSRYLRGRRVRELRAPIAQTSPQTPRPLA